MFGVIWADFWDIIFQVSCKISRNLSSKQQKSQNFTWNLKYDIPEIGSNDSKHLDIQCEESFGCLLPFAHSGWVRKRYFSDFWWNSSKILEFWSKIVTFTTFWATNLVSFTQRALYNMWSPWTLRTTLEVSLRLRTTLFGQIGVNLAHFKSSEIFKLLALVSAKIAFFLKIS